MKAIKNADQAIALGDYIGQFAFVKVMHDHLVTDIRNSTADRDQFIFLLSAMKLLTEKLDDVMSEIDFSN